MQEVERSVGTERRSVREEQAQPTEGANPNSVIVLLSSPGP